MNPRLKAILFVTIIAFAGSAFASERAHYYLQRRWLGADQQQRPGQQQLYL